MTLKLNSFTGTWINEKLTRAKQDAESRKLMEFKAILIEKLWNDYESSFIDGNGKVIGIVEDAAFMVDNIICDNNCLEKMIEEVVHTVPDYEAQFVKHVYKGLRA